MEDSEKRDDMVKLLSFKDHADCCSGQSHHGSRGVSGRPTERPLPQSRGEVMVAWTRLVAVG